MTSLVQETSISTAALFAGIAKPDTMAGISKALLASTTTAALFAGSEMPSISKWLRGSAGMSGFGKASPTALLVPSRPVAGRLYDAYLDGLPTPPNTRRPAFTLDEGDTHTGLLIAESPTLVEAWQTGPADARNDLFKALAELDPSLLGWLKGAWEDIVRDGPKAASKIAHCTIECIDRTLRILAPIAEVTAWIAIVGAKPGWMERNRPTRRARVMFVMRHRSNQDARLAISQVESLATLVQVVAGNLQSVKHGEAPTMAVMRGWVHAAEGALSQLLLYR